MLLYNISNKELYIIYILYEGIVQVNEGISLQIISSFEHYANTLRNLVVFTIETWLTIYREITNRLLHYSSFVTI